MAEKAKEENNGRGNAHHATFSVNKVISNATFKAMCIYIELVN